MRPARHPHASNLYLTCQCLDPTDQRFEHHSASVPSDHQKLVELAVEPIEIPQNAVLLSSLQVDPINYVVVPVQQLPDETHQKLQTVLLQIQYVDAQYHLDVGCLAQPQKLRLRCTDP